MVFYQLLLCVAMGLRMVGDQNNYNSSTEGGNRYLFSYYAFLVFSSFTIGVVVVLQISLLLLPLNA